MSQAWGFINLVFGGGWPPSLLDEMDLDEFLDWLKIAHERNEDVKRANKK